MRDGNVTLNPGQLFIVPKGVEHCPITEGGAHALLVDPADVLNTGEAGGSMTAAFDDTLAWPPPRGVGVPALTGQDRIVHMSEGLDFLGFHIQRRRKQGTSKWYNYTFIADQPIL